MAVKLKWNGDKYLKLVGKKMDAFLKAAGTRSVQIAKANVSDPNTGQVIKLKGSTRKRPAGSRVPIFIPGVGWRLSKNRRKVGNAQNKTQITIYPNSSKPEQAVKMRTGFGRDNIIGGYNKQRKAWRTGYRKAARYMIGHEVGIRYPRAGLQKRPAVVPAVKNNEKHLAFVGRAAAERIKA